MGIVLTAFLVFKGVVFFVKRTEKVTNYFIFARLYLYL